MVRKTTKIIAGISAACLVVSIAIFSIFSWMVSNQKTDHITFAQERAEAKAQKDSLQTLMQQLDGTKTERESLFTRFLKEEDVIDFLALIESLGKEQGVELATKSLQVSPVNNYFESLNVNLEISGSYTQVLSMLALLEELPYQISIFDTQLQKKDDKLWSGVVGVGVTKFIKHES